MTNDKPASEFDDMRTSSLYKNATLPEKIQIAIDHKHYSLESGADANHELFHYLIPQMLKAYQALKLENEQLEELLKEVLETFNADKQVMYNFARPLTNRIKETINARQKIRARF